MSHGPESPGDDPRRNKIVADGPQAIAAWAPSGSIESLSTEAGALREIHPDEQALGALTGVADETASKSVSLDCPTLAPGNAVPLDALTVARRPLNVAAPRSDDVVHHFGDYELLNEIARGGMGVVYKARQTKLNRIVAIKMILSGQLADAADIRRFYTEAEAAANLDHPGIVPVFEVGQHEDQHYFSMAYIEGQSLAQKVANGPLPPSDVAVVVHKICDAMSYAHQRGVIHRDLKPANILLCRDGQPKVTDFGLAKRMEGDSNLTKRNRQLATHPPSRWPRISPVS